MSNLSELLPSGSGGKQFDFVASGTLPNGRAVVLKDNGQVELVAVGAAGTEESEFSTASSQYINSCYDTNSDKIFVNWLDSNTEGYSAIGTISGKSITFGATVTYHTGSQIQNQACLFDSTNNKIVVFFRKPSDGMQARVGTISGTTITYGTAGYLTTESTYENVVFDSNAGKFVIVYRNANASFYGAYRVCTVSGTSISMGSETVFSSISTYYTAVSFDSTSNQVLITYNASSQGKALMGTISGTSLSLGSEATYTTNNSYIMSSAFNLNANKAVVTFRDDGNSNYATSVIGTVSGTSISFGTPSVLASEYGEGNANASAYNPTTQSVFTGVAFTSGGKLVPITNSGTSVVVGTMIPVSTQFAYTDVNYIPDGDLVSVSYRGADNHGNITIYGSATNLTATNFVGITDEAISSAATGKVTIKGGIKSDLSGLTTNSIYYVQGDGTISTVTTSPAVRIGRALSSTSINLEFNT